jgi:hypothetical protein
MIGRTQAEQGPVRTARGDLGHGTVHRRGRRAPAVSRSTDRLRRVLPERETRVLRDGFQDQVLAGSSPRNRVRTPPSSESPQSGQRKPERNPWGAFATGGGSAAGQPRASMTAALAGLARVAQRLGQCCAGPGPRVSSPAVPLQTLVEVPFGGTKSAPAGPGRGSPLTMLGAILYAAPSADRSRQHRCRAVNRPREVPLSPPREPCASCPTQTVPRPHPGPCRLHCPAPGLGGGSHGDDLGPLPRRARQGQRRA